MAAGAYVQLLGQPGVRVNGKVIDFLPNKRFQLLAYLAYQGDWVSRDKLAFLFWPDETDHTARHNLRQLLKYVRKMDWLSGLKADEQRLRWQVETDVAALKEALNSGDAENTIPLYQGPLLPNLEGDGEGGFGEWLAMERDVLHGRWREVLFSRVRELESSEQHDPAVHLLRALMKRDPLDEEGLQAYLRSSFKAGHQEQALSAYRAFTKRLQAELEMEPTSTTEQLAKEIEDALALPPSRRAATVPAETSPAPELSVTVATTTRAAPYLPKPATSFVGRDLELAEVVHLLSQEDCRLLTLVGAGGMGKTRLALQATLELSNNYPEGVCFIPLESLTSPGFIPVALAGALGLELQGREEPLSQVAHFLKDKHVLLVLDNYEHLVEGATITSELLQNCLNLKLLVTSRERLNVEEEWLLPVEGLSYPTSACALEKALTHDAVQLFVQRACKVSPSYFLTEHEAVQVQKVCELTAGSPLGIELAAVWIRTMPVEEIAREIEHNLDFLSSTSRNVKEKHASVRATFEYSWHLLSAKEQEVLRKLSVFRAGFRKEAATIVAGASVSILAALVDKSLLRTSLDGRYDRHPLVLQYTQEKLADNPHEELEMKQRHGVFYLRLLKEWEKIAEFGTPALHYKLESDIENVCVAWEWLVAEVKLKELKHLSWLIGRFLFWHMQHPRAIDLLTNTLARLNEDDPKHRPVMGCLMFSLAFIRFALGDTERTIQLARRSITLLKPAVDNFEHHTKWLALMYLGHTSSKAGDWSGAQLYYKQALTQARQLSDISSNKTTNRQIYLTLSAMAEIEQYVGHYSKAERHHQKVQKSGTSNPDTLTSYGDLLFLTNRFSEAMQIYKQALRQAEERENYVSIAFSQARLALAYCQVEEFDHAWKYCEQALQATAVIRTGPPLANLSRLFSDLGRVLTTLSSYEQARDQLRHALRFGWACREIPLVLHALVCLADLEAKRGCTDRSIRLLWATSEYTCMRWETRSWRDGLLEMLRERWPAKGEEQNPPSLESVVEAVLSISNP